MYANEDFLCLFVPGVTLLLWTMANKNERKKLISIKDLLSKELIKKSY